MNRFDLQSNIPTWVWLALAVLLLTYFGSPLANRADHKKCQRICQAQGFADSRFKPQYRSKTGLQPSSCHCLSEEERQMKNRVPPGTRVF